MANESLLSSQSFSGGVAKCGGSAESSRRLAYGGESCMRRRGAQAQRGGVAALKQKANAMAISVKSLYQAAALLAQSRRKCNG